MSRIDLFLSKIINVFLWVSIISFIFLVIELFFAVAYQALDCSPNQLYCSVRPENPFLQTSISTLITILIIFLFSTRMLYAILEKETRLLNASEYKETLINRRITFSRTKVYTDLRKKSDLAKSSSKLKTDVKKEEIIEEPDKSMELVGLESDTAKLIHEIEEESLKDVKSSDEKEFYTRLNKSELIDIVARATSLNQKSSKLFLNTMLSVITEQLKKDKEVKIGKFGKFKREFIAAHKKINKKSGEEIQIEAESTVNFYPDKVFSKIIALDSEKTSDKVLLTKTELDKLSEDQVQDELIREEKIREHVELKVVLEPQVVEKSKTVRKKTVTKTKLDIIKYINKNTKLSKNKSNKFLSDFEKVITEELSNGNEVHIPGLGTFLTILMPKKEAMNPQTHKIIVVDEHRQVRLRIDSEFKNKFK